MILFAYLVDMALGLLPGSSSIAAHVVAVTAVKLQPQPDAWNVWFDYWLLCSPFVYCILLSQLFIHFN